MGGGTRDEAEFSLNTFYSWTCVESAPAVDFCCWCQVKMSCKISLAVKTVAGATVHVTLCNPQVQCVSTTQPIMETRIGTVDVSDTQCSYVQYRNFREMTRYGTIAAWAYLCDNWFVSQMISYPIRWETQRSDQNGARIVVITSVAKLNFSNKD